MKYSLLLLFISSTLLGSCQNKIPVTDFKKMEWLIGTWQGESNAQPFYEHWTRISDTEFDNTNYTICNGDTIRGGHSRIEIVDGEITYTSDNLRWRLQELNDSLILFENAQRREKFTFTRTAKGEWKAHLQYPRSRVEYLLARTRSISELLANKPSPLIGYYEGYIEFAGKKLLTSIQFGDKNGKQTATTSTPDNLQLDMPFSEVCYNPPFLKLRLRDGTQVLELNAKTEGNNITGNLAGEIPAKLFFKKTDLPVKAVNYKIVPLAIRNAGISLPANLFLPVSGKPTGAVIMVCGTGQHVKEEYNGWADMLASKGVAVLCYDKRNVTSTRGLNIRQASSDIVLPGELESDIEAAISTLKSRKEVNPSKIGLFGFSQGAVMVPIVAAGNKDVAFIVAVSGNTTTDQEFIINQSLNRMRQRSFSAAAIQRTRQIWEELFAYVKDRKNGTAIQQKLDEAYEERLGRYSVPRLLPNEDEIKYLSTWNSFEHDPAIYWSKLNIPSYVVFGDRDVFIPVSESISILDSLFKNRPGILTMKVYPGTDHYIKQVPDRNNFDFPRFAAGYIHDLAGWIVKQGK